METKIEYRDTNLMILYNNMNFSNVDFSDRHINESGYIESRMGPTNQKRYVDCIDIDQEEIDLLDTI